MMSPASFLSHYSLEVANDLKDPLLSQWVLFNARSVRNKLPDLQAPLFEKRPSLAFITEFVRPRQCD